MMPKKAPEEKRSIILGVKVDKQTREKIEYLAEMNGIKTSTYIYNLIKKHIEEKEQAAQLDWARAVEHVRDVQYETYSPACRRTCKKLLDRYHKGERSKNLYEQMLVM